MICTTEVFSLRRMLTLLYTYRPRVHRYTAGKHRHIAVYRAGKLQPDRPSDRMCFHLLHHEYSLYHADSPWEQFHSNPDISRYRPWRHSDTVRIPSFVEQQQTNPILRSTSTEDFTVTEISKAPGTTITSTSIEQITEVETETRTLPGKCILLEKV